MASPAVPTAEQFGIVKEILSGDSIVIRGKPVKGPPPEKTVQLAGIVAPRLARRPSPNRPEEQKDEPFAWQAREALRHMLVGKQIKYVIEYTVPTTGRDFVRITTKDGKDVASEMVAQGWLKVRPQTNQQSTPEHDNLLHLEQIAQNAGLGAWSKDPAVIAKAVRNPQWNVDTDRSLVVSKHKYNAVVEQVRDGSTLRLFLLPDFKYITVQLAGIKTPGFKRAEDGSNVDVAEPYADEAKFFVESRLLQRDVQVLLEGVTNQNFLATIIHPAGNISELLLKEGMARVVDWSLTCVTEGKEKYRAMEQLAKAKKLRIFRDYVAPAGFAGEKEFVAKVVEICNAETIVVKDKTGALRRLTISSIRGPKAPEGVKPKNHFDTPYLYEAKEFMRKRMIGKNVRIIVDFVKPANEGFPERTCVTVMDGTVNIGEALVSKGFCTVVRYRADDDQRSSHFDELLAAEQRAIAGNKGLHKQGDVVLHRVNDTSSNKEVAKNFYPFLQRAPRQKGVADYVIHGARLRIYIPKENAIISFVLSGISCPRTGRNDGENKTPSQPGAEEATQFTRDMCMQRDVTIQIDGMDKTGNFIGCLWVDDENLALRLVEKGLSSVHFSADRLNFGKELFAAEEAAKTAKIGIWKNYVEEKVEVTEEVKERDVKYKEVVISEVASGRTLFVQDIEKAVELEQFVLRLNQFFTANPPIVGTVMPKAGEIVAAKFTEDNTWYRAKVTKVNGSDVTVFFVDYGNCDIVKPVALAPLPTEFSLVSLPAVAREVNLACIELPEDADWQQEAIYFLKEGVMNKRFFMNPEYSEEGKQAVTIMTPETQVDLGKTLLAAGLATVQKRKEFRLKSLLKEYNAAQELACKEH
eukprot:Ihof_evm5s61 gene=Ihof_evmTU5s61